LTAKISATLQKLSTPEGSELVDGVDAKITRTNWLRNFYEKMQPILTAIYNVLIDSVNIVGEVDKANLVIT
jgi:hypothetical protein